MYRQIRNHDQDVDYQRILWRHSTLQSMRSYHGQQLLTVRYSMNCAPYLALRVLQQLGINEGQEFPLAFPILRDNFYVDDCLELMILI